MAVIYGSQCSRSGQDSATSDATLLHLQVLRSHTTTISIKELSETTGIKVDDVLSTLQHLNLIQYQKGQHVICAAPTLLDK